MQNVKQTKLKKQSACSLIFIEITVTSSCAASLLWTCPLAAQVGSCGLPALPSECGFWCGSHF